MFVRPFARLAVVATAFLFVLTLPATSMGDSAADLVVAEESESAARAEVSIAEEAVRQAEAASQPIQARANAADKAVAAAEAEVESIRDELVSEREKAVQEIQAAEADYDDERSSYDTTTAVGIGIAAVALLIAIGAFAVSRFQQWPLSIGLTQLAAAGLGLLFLAGLGVALISSSPQAPQFSSETMELAANAEGDPADPPSDELTQARAAAEPLAEKAEPLDEQREKAEGAIADAESKLDQAQTGLDNARGEVRFAENAVEREELKAEKEAAFREEATPIDYDQLIKNPFRYVGEKVVYTGQIFQIQEGFGSFMLLSVTDEGYGFWTDEIWVSGFGEIESAEEDIVTVYGTVVGAEEYETQIGGSRYVPKVKAKYIDE